ncbi:MAG: right-handed parallel beta-helix repeat-containing protein [Nanoarchaeota archaeon]
MKKIKTLLLIFSIVFFLTLPERVEAEEIIKVYGCERLNVSNSRYVLQANIIVNSSCFSINANNLVFDLNNHVIKHAEMSLKSPLSYGIFVSEKSNVEITNGFISGFGRDIFVLNSNKIKISKMELSTDGFFGNSTTIAPIYIDTADKLEIKDISITKGKNRGSYTNVYGLSINKMNNSKLFNVNVINVSKSPNTVGSSGRGIRLSQSSNNELKSIMLRDTNFAFEMYNGENNIIENIRMENNSHGGLNLLSYSNNNQIKNARVMKSGVSGITLGGQNNTISDSLIEQNTYGISFAGSNRNNRVENIILKNNQISIEIDEGSVNTVIDHAQLHDSQFFGIWFWGGTTWATENILIKNSNIENSGESDVYFWRAGGENIIFEDSNLSTYFIEAENKFGIRKTGFGEIRFIQPVTGSGSFNDITINNNRALINAELNPGLNKKARIVLSNVLLPYEPQKFKILRNRQPCQSCMMLSSGGKENTFTVPGDGSYSIA